MRALGVVERRSVLAAEQLRTTALRSQNDCPQSFGTQVRSFLAAEQLRTTALRSSTNPFRTAPPRATTSSLADLIRSVPRAPSCLLSSRFARPMSARALRNCTHGGDRSALLADAPVRKPNEPIDHSTYSFVAYSSYFKNLSC